MASSDQTFLQLVSNIASTVVLQTATQHLDRRLRRIKHTLRNLAPRNNIPAHLLLQLTAYFKAEGIRRDNAGLDCHPLLVIIQVADSVSFDLEDLLRLALPKYWLCSQPGWYSTETVNLIAHITPPVAGHYITSAQIVHNYSR